MKFVLSFLMTGALLSASTCYKLSVGNAATTTQTLCNPVNMTPSQPAKCVTPTPALPTIPTIQCNVPTINTPAPQVTAKCSPAPVICTPTPICKTPVPVIENPKSNQPGCGKDPGGPSSATPEPASFALLGAGLVGAGLWRKARS